MRVRIASFLFRLRQNTAEHQSSALEPWLLVIFAEGDQINTAL